MGKGGGDEYDWLYDASGGDTPNSEVAPPTTRPIPSYVEPTRPLDTRASQPRGGATTAPPRPPVLAPTPQRRPRRGRTIALVAGGLLLGWLLYLVIVPVLAWNGVSRANASPKSARPSEQPGTTYLVVGSDARRGLAGRRTDSIMLLHTGAGPTTLVSLPRDSLVNVPGHGVTKINAAFAYGGPRLLTRTVEGATGVRVDDYVEIGFNGFKKIVDSVGGITVCPKQAVRDQLAHINIDKGCQQVDGKTALGYARSRHAFALGDIARAKNQREVISAIGAEVLTPSTFLNPFRYWKVVHSAADSVRVGQDTGVVGAAKFARAMTQVDGESGLTCAVPIRDLAVHWDKERATRLFNLISADRTDQIGKSICRADGLAP